MLFCGFLTGAGSQPPDGEIIFVGGSTYANLPGNGGPEHGFHAEAGAGMKKEQAGRPKKVRLPITPSILRQIRQRWERQGTEWDQIILWAAVCLCFFGFLRSGEVVVPSDTGFDARGLVLVRCSVSAMAAP